MNRNIPFAFDKDVGNHLQKYFNRLTDHMLFPYNHYIDDDSMDELYQQIL